MDTLVPLVKTTIIKEFKEDKRPDKDEIKALKVKYNTSNGALFSTKLVEYLSDENKYKEVFKSDREAKERKEAAKQLAEKKRYEKDVNNFNKMETLDKLTSHFITKYPVNFKNKVPAGQLATTADEYMQTPLREGFKTWFEAYYGVSMKQAKR